MLTSLKTSSTEATKELIAAGAGGSGNATPSGSGSTIQKHPMPGLPGPTSFTPFMVRISAEVIAAIRASVENPDTQGPPQLAGILLGTATDRFVSVEALQSFRSSTNLEEGMKAWSSQPQLQAQSGSALPKLIGWYALRATNNPALLDDEVTFHERHFPESSDIAVLFGGGHTQEIHTTVYARSSEGVFDLEHRRMGSIRLFKRDGEASALLSVIGQNSFDPDLYAQAYGITTMLEKAERRVALSPATLIPFLLQSARETFLDARRGRLRLTLCAAVVLLGLGIVVLANRHAPAYTAVAETAAIATPPKTASEDVEAGREMLNGTVPAEPDISVNRRTGPENSKRNRKQERLPSRSENVSPAQSKTATPRVFAASAIGNVHVPAPADRHVVVAAPPSETTTTATPLSQVAGPMPMADSLLPQPAPPPVASTPAGVRFGQLATTAPVSEAEDYMPPQPLKAASPRAPASALASLSAPLALEVQVDIDKSGHVTQARVLNPGKADGALIEAARSAARQWVFQPATRGGKKVASRHTMMFQFRSSSGTR